MSLIVGLLDRYRKWSKMTDLPDDTALIQELRRREDSPHPKAHDPALESMFSEIDEAQTTIDNRSDALEKLTAFLGAGLAALGKLDGRTSIKVLSLLVVCLCGGSLGLALLAANHSAHRTTLLLPAGEGDLKQGCVELKRNQRLLAAATLFGLAAGAFAVVTVFASIV